MNKRSKSSESHSSELEYLRQRVSELEVIDEVHRQSEEAERLRAKGLDALFNVANVLAQPGTFDEKVEQVLGELAQVTEGDRVVLRLSDSDNEVLKLVASVGPGLQDPPPIELLPYGELLAGVAFQRGEPVVVNDYVSYSKAEPERVTQGIQSVVAVPVKSAGNVLGTININSRHKDHFTAERVRMLTAIADGMGALLENARLMEAVRESEERYRTLFEQSRDAIFIAREDHGTVEVNQAAVDLLGYTRDEVASLPPEQLFVDLSQREAITRELAATGSVQNFEIRMRKKNGEEIDCLISMNQRWSADGKCTSEEGVVRDITERKRAEEEVRRLADENAVMAEIGRIINSSLDIKQVYDRFADETRKIIPFDRISIGLVDLENGIFTDSYSTGIEIAGRGSGVVNQLAGSVTEEVVTSRQSKVLELFDADELAEHYYLMKAGYEAGLRSSVTVPLISGDNPLGVMHFQSTVPSAYGEHEIHLAERVAANIAGAIAKWQLYSDLREAQEDIRDSEQRLRTLVMAVPVPVTLTRVLDGKILYANEHVSSLFGRTADELTGDRAFSLYYDPADREPLIKELTEHGYLRNHEVRAKNADGEAIWVNVSAQPTTFDGEDSLLTSFTDVTEQKKAEELFKTLAQSSPVGMFMIQDRKFAFVNDRFLEERGNTEEEVIGKDALEFILPEDRHLVEENSRRMRKGEIEWPYEYRAFDKQGNVLWLMGTTATIDYGGKPAIVGSYMNITERKQAEELFKTLAQSSPVGIFVVEDGKFSFVNAQACKDSGYTEEELLGKEAIEYVHSDDRQIVVENNDKMSHGETTEPYEYRSLRKDGSAWWMLGNFARITYEGRPALIGTYVDIDDRKAAEEQLRDSLQEKEALLEEIQQLYAQEQRRAHQFRVINEVGQRITSILDIDQLLQDVSLLIKEGFGYPVAHIGLVQGDDLVYKIGTGEEESVYRNKVGEEGITGIVASSGEPILLADVREDPRFISVPEYLDTQSELAVPIKSKGKVIGVLNAESDQIGAFDESDLLVLQNLANQIAISIENARLFRAEQRRADQFRLIDEVGRKITSILEVDELLQEVASSIQEAFGYHHVGIGLIEGEDVHYKVGAGVLGDDPAFRFEPAKLKVGQTGITGRVAATGEPIIARDVSKNPHYVRMRHSKTRSELTVPIRAKGRVIGILDVQSDQINDFDETDLTVLQSLADQTGISIENAQLFETEQLQLEHLTAINDVAIRVSSIFSVDELLPFVANLMYETFRPYSVNIGLIDTDTNEIVIRASAGRYTGDSPVGRTFNVGIEGNGICSWVAETGESMVSNNVLEEPLYHHLEEMSETKSELTVPISMGDEVIGILDIESDYLDSFGSMDVSTALNVANQLAIAIENARLLDETRDVAVLEERNRMAREIHDTMAQGFTGIVLQLEAAEQAYDETPVELPEHLDRAKSLARECLQEARRSVWNLLPKALEERPLAEALQEEVQRFSLAGREQAKFSIGGRKRDLPSDIQAALLRVCQESLTNVRKHAQASEVAISLEYLKGSIRLTIKDDGVGFDNREEKSDIRQGGFGLNGMNQRAKLLRGTLTVNSKSGDGTQIEVDIPTS